MPKSLTYFNHNWFKYNYSLNYISLPDSIKEMSDYAFKNFKINQLYLPSSLTSLKNNWFIGCSNLTKLMISSSVINVEWNALKQLPKLKELDIESPWKIYGEKLFRNYDNCLYSIDLPSSIKLCNHIKPYKLFSFTIPTNVTKLSDYCFSNCNELEILYGIENIKMFGKNCFFNCNKLNYKIDNNVFGYSNNYISIIEKWTGLHCYELLFDSDIHNWSHGNNDIEKNMFYNDSVIIIENEEGELFGNYISKQQNKSFHFNLQSNDKLKEPIKYEIKDKKHNNCKVFNDEDEFMYLMEIGDITVMKKERKDQCWYCPHNDIFNYHSISFPLGGKEIDCYGCISFCIKRFIIIHMN